MGFNHSGKHTPFYTENTSERHCKKVEKKATSQGIAMLFITGANRDNHRHSINA